MIPASTTGDGRFKSVNSDYSALRYPPAAQVETYREAATAMPQINHSWRKEYTEVWRYLSYQRALGLAYSE